MRKIIFLVSMLLLIAVTIAEGETYYYGDSWDWSNYGNALDLVSPAGGEYESPSDIYTLDIVGEGGYNPYVYGGCENTNSDYVCFFDGTSAAAPPGGWSRCPDA